MTNTADLKQVQSHGFRRRATLHSVLSSFPFINGCEQIFKTLFFVLTLGHQSLQALLERAGMDVGSVPRGPMYEK